MLRSISFAISIVMISTMAAATNRQQGSSGRKGSITGRVICEDGQIPANLRISLWSPRDRSAIPRQLAIDDAGRFQADDLAPGSYTVNAYAPGYVPADSVSRQRYYRIGDSVTLKIKKGGVITGTVNDANGTPVVGVRVSIFRVRDAEGRRVRTSQGTIARPTDDRGVYRAYGLQPGSYVVLAAAFFKAPSSDTDVIAPTYHPSATRDTAAEVNVAEGQETSGIDIRYRSDRGFSVSGTVSGKTAQTSNPIQTIVQIIHANSGAVEGSVFLTEDTFTFDGVPNGQYLILARNTANKEESVSPPVKITVKGTDVTGLNLRLAPLGSISGRIILARTEQSDQQSSCKERQGITLEESVITMRRDVAKNEKSHTMISLPETNPDDKGEFRIIGGESARYRLEANLPTESWYVRSITLPLPDNKTRDIPSEGLALKHGDKVTNITITVSDGAASLRGKVTNAKEGASLPSRLRVHLIPAERESAENPLRYYEVGMQNDFTFAMTNIAPGKYWIIARPAIEDESGIEISQPAAWDAEMRKRLRLDSSTTGAPIDLKSCQHTGDYLLRYAQPVAAKAAKN